MKLDSTLEKLRAHESRNITFIEADGSWPVVWERARGMRVWDSAGKEYLDLTAAFGVAASGHANARVVRAGASQMRRLLHAMGDVHPHALKADLAQKLSEITFERWTARESEKLLGKTIFCSSGFEAVEAALKTAVLASGKPGVIAFTGAYHGLGYGALNATHRAHFKTPFASQLGQFGHFVSFPKTEAELPALENDMRAVFQSQPIGAVLAEPVQARGGINIPPPGFLPLLRRLCSEQGALLILDEIYTGFGRTGKWFACEHTETVPDLICLGKALTGGFPLSACVGKAAVMDAWPAAGGEAIHTSTFLGHPVGCAMALAQIEEIQTRGLVGKSEQWGGYLRKGLEKIAADFPRLKMTARGLGLMAGLEICLSDGAPATGAVLEAVKTLLHRGYIFLPEGEHSNVLGFTPPLIVGKKQLQQTLAAVREVFASLPL